MKFRFLCVFIFINIRMVHCMEHLLNEGDVCAFNSTIQGVCKKMYQCPIVQESLRSLKITPVMCGLTSKICCPRFKLFPKRKKTTIGHLAKKFCEENVNRIFHKDAGGGVNALLGEFTSMAAIGWHLADGTGYDWNCGGTLISTNYVLTAAHCTLKYDDKLREQNPTVVRLGALNLRKKSNKTLDVKIVEIFVHPEYKAPVKYNDIALLKLAEEILQTNTIKAACLVITNNRKIMKAIYKIPLKAFGWGETERSKQSDILQKVTIKAVDNKKCNASYKTRRGLPNGIIDSQICAGADGKQDTCRGDSGGPLLILSRDSFYLLGITSFGIGCLGSTAPGVYTRVSSYIDWIESIVWK